MPKETKEKILKIIDNFLEGILFNSKRIVPEDFIKKGNDLLKEKFANQILELFEEEKQKWIEDLDNLKARNLESIDTKDIKGYFLKSNLEIRNKTIDEVKNCLNKELKNK